MGAVQFDSTISGGEALDVEAGSTPLTAGAITFGGAIGATPLTSLKAVGGAITLGAAATSGGQTYDGLSLTQAGTLVGTALAVALKNDTAATISLTNASNDFTSIALSTAKADGTTPAKADISYTDLNGVDVAGILNDQANAAIITAGGAITDSGLISTGTLRITSVGGATLDFGHNAATFDAANSTSGNIYFKNGEALSLGDVTYSVTSPNGTTITIANTGAVTIANSVSAGSGTSEVDIDTGGSGQIIETRHRHRQYAEAPDRERLDRLRRNGGRSQAPHGLERRDDDPGPRPGHGSRQRLYQPDRSPEHRRRDHRGRGRPRHRLDRRRGPDPGYRRAEPRRQDAQRRCSRDHPGYILQHRSDSLAQGQERRRLDRRRREHHL